MRQARIDFLRQPGVPPLGWVLLALGTLGLLFALWLDRGWSLALERAEREAKAAVEERRTRDRPAPPPKTTDEQLRWLQTQAAQRRPWLPVLRAVESAAAPPVYLLSLSIDPESGTVKIEGDAPSFDHAMAFVQILDESGALAPAVLVSHEQVSDPVSSRSFVHFTASTRWTLR